MPRIRENAINAVEQTIEDTLYMLCNKDFTADQEEVIINALAILLDKHYQLTSADKDPVKKFI